MMNKTEILVLYIVICLVIVGLLFINYLLGAVVGIIFLLWIVLDYLYYSKKK